MEGDELYSVLLERLRAVEEGAAARIAGLDEVVDLLVRILAGNGVLNPGHRRLLAKVRERAQRPKIRLRVLTDKYQVPDSGSDCARRLPVCRARCCALTVELSGQDLAERSLLWELEQPYLLRRENDGLCSHLDRSTRRCSVYQARPASCREYDCRNDDRIWLDFEKMIPAP